MTTATTEKPPLRFGFVLQHGERAGEINDFYNGFMKLSRPLAAYEWEFQHGAGGPALVWAVIHPEDERIVGSHCIVPTPLVRRGVDLSGGRTENTIIDPAVRTKVFYPGMEKRALSEALKTLSVLYTIHSTGPGPLRERLGYKSAGRWELYLPKVGLSYMSALLQRGRKVLPKQLPDALLRVAAVGATVVLRGLQRRAPVPADVDVVEVPGLDAVEAEYAQLWREARASYDLTIDRSVEFLRWRVSQNPHLRFRTWAIRRSGRLLGIVIAHAHRIGSALALYVDDVIMRAYDDRHFELAASCLRRLDAAIDTVTVQTLSCDTPLRRALQRQLPLQAAVLRRWGAKLFDEMLVLNHVEPERREPWYVTAIFTEGMDTSR